MPEYPRRLLTEGESVVREFRPHWRLLVLPALWTVLAVALIVVVYSALPVDPPWNHVLVLAVFIGWLVFAAWPFAQWWFTLYVLTTERLITRSGILARKGLEIPLENINDVQFSQTIIERLLRSGDLLIESAGELGQSRFSDIPEPEEFQSLLYRVREERSIELQQGPGGAAATEPEVADPTERLHRLADLRERGVISDEEYEEKRRKLLDEI
jgi:uncharacterized membrane protein YdbT with pleckstrin-like domain